MANEHNNDGHCCAPARFGGQRYSAVAAAACQTRTENGITVAYLCNFAGKDVAQRQLRHAVRPLRGVHNDEPQLHIRSLEIDPALHSAHHCQVGACAFGMSHSFTPGTFMKAPDRSSLSCAGRVSVQVARDQGTKEQEHLHLHLSVHSRSCLCAASRIFELHDDSDSMDVGGQFGWRVAHLWPQHRQQQLHCSTSLKPQSG